MGWRYTLDQLADWLNCDKGIHGDVAVTGVSTDTRSIAPGDLFVALEGPNFNADDFVAAAFAQGAAAAICKRPHAEGPCLVVPNPLGALQTWATRHRMSHDIPIFAVTGSCGKTTTKDLTAALLESRYKVIKTKGNLNNDIGCPLSLLRIDRDTAFAVIEMGANHVGEIDQLCQIARPTESAVTLVAPGHLEGFGSIEAVAKAKSEIVSGLDADGCFYKNMDNPWCRAMGEDFRGEIVRFGHEGDIVLKSQSFDAAGEMVLEIDPIGTIRLPLLVPAHAMNVVLAVAVGLRHGITEFEGPLRAACGNAVRFKVRSLGPWELLDDAYNANPASMAAALEALAARAEKGRRIAVLGEMLELGEDAAALHRGIGTLAGERGVDVLFACGEHACDIIAGARDAGIDRAEAFESHEAIADALVLTAAPGDSILLKGSRGMRMERVVEHLERRFPPAGEE